MTFVPVSLSKRQSDVSVSQNKSTISLAVNSVDMDFSTSDITLTIPSFNEFFFLLLFIVGLLFSAKTPSTSTRATFT